MANFYVDVVSGASGNSGASELLPKQYLSQVTMSAGNRIFPKRGQTHPVGAYRFFASNQTMTPFGTGAKPVIQKSAGSDAWLYIMNASNVLIEHIDIDPNGFGGICIALSANNAGNAVANSVLRNIKTEGCPNSFGFYLQGYAGNGTVRNVTLEDCESNDNYNHGFMVASDCANVVFRRCIARGNGAGVGGHNFSAWSGNASYVPTGTRWEFCEASECVDFDGIEGPGFQSDDLTANSVMLGCYSHHNAGAGFVVNLGSGTHVVMGCLGVGNGKAGIHAAGATGSHKFLSNTLSGNDTLGIHFKELIVSNGGATNYVVSNNVLINTTSVAKGISFAATGGHTGATNCIFGYATPSENITLTGTVTSDPLLTSGYRLTSASPCKGAGTYIASAKHFGGASMNPASPDIGAVRAGKDRSGSMAVFAPAANYSIALPGGSTYVADVFSKTRRCDFGGQAPIVWTDGATGIATVQHSGLTRTGSQIESTYPNGEATHWERGSSEWRIAYNTGEALTASACRCQMTMYPTPISAPVVFDMAVQFGDATNNWTLTTNETSPCLFWQLKESTASPVLALIVDTDALDASKLQVALSHRVSKASSTTRLATFSGLARHVMHRFQVRVTPAYDNAGLVQVFVNGALRHSQNINTLTSDATSYHACVFGIYMYNDLVPASAPTRVTHWGYMRQYVLSAGASRTVAGRTAAIRTTALLRAPG